MQSFTEHDIIEFYKECSYPFRKGRPPRPRDMNIPKLIAQQDDEYIKELTSKASDGRIQDNLDKAACQALIPVLLHESLFHFYKGFYNYLAARALYFGGMWHWINISLYYARFYLARSVATLAGQQSYGVHRYEGEFEDPGSEEKTYMPNYDFSDEIAAALQGKARKIPDTYSIRLEIDLVTQTGSLIFHKNSISSHEVVWNDYSNLQVDRWGLFSLTYISKNYEKSERNRENYSFDGYRQLDFNLNLGDFEQEFEQDVTKRGSDTIYDLQSGDVLMAISTQMNLYRKFNISSLPIEKEKFAYMVSYCLPESQAKEKLLQLCEEEFPTRSLYSEDGALFYDDRGIYL